MLTFDGMNIIFTENCYMDRFRKLLEKNKDIINFITSSLLGFMALTVSVKSCEIADANLKVAEMSYLPVFSITSRHQEGIETVSVDNKGYHVTELRIQSNTYLIFGTERNDIPTIREVHDYFPNRYTTTNTSGVLLTLKSNTRNARIHKALNKALFELNESESRSDENSGYVIPPWISRYMHFVHIIKLQYIDGLGEHVSKYYKIENSAYAIELNELDAAVFLENDFANPLILDKIVYDSIPNVLRGGKGY